MKTTAMEAIEELRQNNVTNLLKFKEQGIKVVGSYCTYCPRELIIAAGAVSVGLCGTRDAPIAAAEKDLPRNLCPMVKSSYGLAITDQCPYFAMSDLVIGETTCDGKKKMFEVMKNKGIKDIYVMNLPHMPDYDSSRRLWVEELERFKDFLEKKFGVKITEEKLREAIHRCNEEHRAKQDLFDLNRAIPAVISGMDLLTVSFQVGYQADRRETIRMLDELTAATRSRAAAGQYVGNITTKRILLTGTPVGVGSEKVLKLIEESGALVVAMETCGGYKTVGLRIDENDPSDPLELMAEKYMKIPCSIMSPNTGRTDLLRQMISDFQIDGVVDLTWQACHTYNIESYFVAELVKTKLEMPFLQLETDYSQSDIETLRVRIEAFLEMI
jgi:benzoyl-CoA reductase/2-hydroxyglutaryl-CoA dehydratase subunit BcrC/BadD/HgdB